MAAFDRLRAAVLVLSCALSGCAPAERSSLPRTPSPTPSAATRSRAAIPSPPAPTPVAPPWPSIAPDGYELAASHWTRAGHLWLLLRPSMSDGSHPLRVCALASSPTAAQSLRRARCRDVPDTVPRFAVPEVGFALDDEPIVVGPDPQSQARRIGYSAETGAPVPIRGMVGRERRRGLTVERRAFGRYEVMQVVDGEVKRSAILNVPPVDAMDNQPYDPVVIEDQVGWFRQADTKSGWGWFFSPLGAAGLSPRFVGGEYPLGCQQCGSGPFPAVELGGACCPYFAFLRDGRWSRPVHTDSSLIGAGPRLMLDGCRENVAVLMLAEHGLVRRDEFVVEQNRCTPQGCEAKTVRWQTPRPDGLIVAAPLVDDSGVEKVAVAWQDKQRSFTWKLAPIEQLERCEPRSQTLPHRVVRDGQSTREDDILVRDGVVLVVFRDAGLRILRVDVDGNVGPVEVERE